MIHDVDGKKRTYQLQLTSEANLKLGFAKFSASNAQRRLMTESVPSSVRAVDSTSWGLVASLLSVGALVAYNAKKSGTDSAPLSGQDLGAV